MNFFKWLFGSRMPKEIKPPDPTYEEMTEKILKENIGKRIILYKAKTLQYVVLREPSYSQTGMGEMRISHYEESIKTKVTSAESIDGTLEDVVLGGVKVNHTWYILGTEPEKIFDYTIISVLDTKPKPDTMVY